jgi:TPR repeat protein
MDGPAKDVCDAYSASINESFYETLKLAEDGSSAAQYRLAGYYHHGVNTEVDLDKYEMWLEQASKKGHVPAMAEYAGLLLSKDEVGNHDRALELYRAAAQRGNFDARRRDAHLRGRDPEGEKALRDILRKLAESGYPVDVCEYGKAVLTTATSDEDKALAYEMFCKAAEAGNAEALFRKAVMLRTGIGVTRSISEAMACLEEAADLGHPRAMTMLADMYLDGRIVKKDLEKAFQWYMVSAETGNPRSQYQVADMLSTGLGTEKDEEAADLWFRRNYFSNLNESRRYAIDAASRRNLDDCPEFDRLIRDSAEAGNVQAMTKLASMLSTGRKIDRALPTALSLYETMAKGQSRNRVPLAAALSDGTCCESDPERAFELYMQAANNGDKRAMYAVACMYRDGRGVEMDRDLYKYYTHMAAAYGDRDAADVVMKWKHKENKRRRKASKDG